MKKMFINDLKPKDTVETIFMVKYMAMMEARDGRNYLNVVLCDSTGDLESRKWHGAQAIMDTIERGNIVLVKGKLNLYQGRRQLIIDKISRYNEEVDESLFVAKSDKPAGKMYEQLLSIVEGIENIFLKELLKNILLDPEISRRLQVWQAGKTVHHAYQSGLLEHILGCAELGVALSNVYKVNKSYVVAGIILHDIGKIYELTDGALVEYTEEGKLLGHLMKGTELIDQYTQKIKDFPYQMKLHLKHIVLSHHGEHEYGSPKLPQTSEALLVHHIDLMDSKMHSFETAKKMDSNAGNWTNYVKYLDRIVFKGELPEAAPVQKEKSDSKKRGSEELKHNMTDMLKDFKVDD